MPSTARGKWFFYFNVLLVAVLVAYKLYLNFFEQDFAAVHADQVERSEALIENRDSYRFAVVGNINNSVGIFERKIIPMLNRSDVDFVISAGNAVSSGGEDKYRALHRTLGRLNKPYLLTFGENEASRLGGFRFYDHYGPYLFSFPAGDSRFIFLDSTGKTDYQWQLRWLEEELAISGARHRFVFSAYPLKPVALGGLLDLDEKSPLPEGMRERMTTLIEAVGVDAVFSAGPPVYSDQQHSNTHYLVTGGAGGLVFNTERSYYHYVEVTVDKSGISVAPVRLEIGQHPFWRTLESLWFFIHSLFYVGYLNFILMVSVLIVIALWAYARVFTDGDYYPDLDLDLARYQDRCLKVAMFTNNYLPFIGGVPIAIDRLRRGLTRLGHSVLVVAPCYGKTPRDGGGELRVRSLLPMGGDKEFRLPNIFSPRLYWRVAAFRPDVIHVHHPFWLGSVGLLSARLLRVPVVYTYHTRLEHYAHYVPLPGPLFRNLVSHALVRRFASRCDAVVVPTESAEEYLRTIGVKRPVLVLPTGIEYERFQRDDAAAITGLRTQLGLGDERVLISISRLSKEKNIDFLLEATRELVRRETAPFGLLIIGDGPERERLQSRTGELGLTGIVQLIGAVTPVQIPLYCQLGDLFVFASRSETQGMVILEAMAAGLPAVVVRASGIDDMVRNGHNDLKTPLDRDRWVDCVERLLADESLRLRLSANARIFAKAYSVDAFGEKMTRTYAHAPALRDRQKNRAV